MKQFIYASCLLTRNKERADGSKITRKVITLGYLSLYRRVGHLVTLLGLLYLSAIIFPSGRLNVAVCVRKPHHI